MMNKDNKKFQKDEPLDVLDYFEPSENKIEHKMQEDGGSIQKFSLEKQDFEWIMEKLLGTPMVCAFHVQFPDTIFHDACLGKAVSVFKTEGVNGHLVKEDRPNKLHFSILRTQMSLIVRGRWKAKKEKQPDIFDKNPDMNAIKDKL